MASSHKTSLDLTRDESANGYTVRFDDTLYTDGGVSERAAPSSSHHAADEPLQGNEYWSHRRRRRRRSGILKRRENTITTADAPPIILSDEGLKAGRVSPFINFPLFMSMTVRSVGIIFGDM
jgi:hypothetical protein